MRTDSPNKALPCILLLLAVFIIFRFFFEVCQQTLNVPHRDDFDTYLNFLVRWEQAPSFAQKFGLLFEPHNEHVIAFLKAGAVLARYTFGGINFRILALLGDLALLILLFGLLSSLSINAAWERRAVAALPVIALLFQPRIYEATMWATTAMSLLWVVAFAVCGFSLLVHERVAARIIGQILLILACLSNGNGIVALGLGAFMLFSRRRILEGSIGLLLCASWLIFVRGISAPSVTSNVSGNLLEHAAKIIDYGLVFIGSGLAHGDLGLAWYLGLVQLLVVAMLFAVGLPRKNLALAASICFILLSIAANSYLRSGLGIGSALSSRYQFFSVLLLGTIYLAFLELVSGKKTIEKYAVSIGAVLALVFNFTSYPLSKYEVETFREFIIYPTLEWMGGDGRTGLSYFDTQQAAQALEKAEHLGIYKLPVEELTREFSTELKDLPAFNEKAKVEYSVDSLIETRYMLSIFGWACMLKSKIIEPQVEILLESAQDRHLFSSKTIMRPDVSKHFSILTGKTKNLDRSGFIARIPKSELAPGVYRLGLVVRGGKRAYLRWIESELRIE